MISLNPTFMKNIEDISVFSVMSSPNSGRLLLHFFYGDYCLFNPVTGAYVIIRYPAPQPSGSTFPVGFEGLVDDVSSPHYNLVAILQRPRIGILDGGLLRICIFESDRNSWRERIYEMVDVPPVRGCITSDRDSTRPVLVNGRLYWLVYVLGYKLVLVFDVNNEVPSIIEGPDLPDGSYAELGNGAGGSFAILAAYDGGKSGKFGIYVLDYVEKKWQAQRIIEDSIPGARVPLYFDEEIFISVVRGGGLSVHAYKMRENTWEKCGNLENMDQKRCFHYFVPTLANIPGCSYLQFNEKTHMKLEECGNDDMTEYVRLQSLLSLRWLECHAHNC